MLDFREVEQLHSILSEKWIDSADRKAPVNSVVLENDENHLGDDSTKPVDPENDDYYRGLVHFYKNKDRKWVFVKEEELQSKAYSFPALVYATRHPIKDFKTTRELLPYADGKPFPQGNFSINSSLDGTQFLRD